MSDSFFLSVEKNEVEKIQALIKEIDINQKNKFGTSALHIATLNGFVNMIEFLIQAGIDLNLQDKEGKTSLHYVAEYNRLEIGELLLKHHADLSIQDKYGNQPLWTAVFNDKGKGDRVGIIKLFLKYGANADHNNNVNKSPRDIIEIARYDNLRGIVI